MKLIYGIPHLRLVLGFVWFLRVNWTPLSSFSTKKTAKTHQGTIMLQNTVSKKHQFKMKSVIISKFDNVHFGLEELFGSLTTVRWVEVGQFQRFFRFGRVQKEFWKNSWAIVFPKKQKKVTNCGVCFELSCWSGAAIEGRFPLFLVRFVVFRDFMSRTNFSVENTDII